MSKAAKKPKGKNADRKGVGRPRSADPRRNRLSVQFTDAEWERLTSVAGAGSLADYVRSKALG